MQQYRKLVGFGLGCFLVFLLATLPARAAFFLFAPAGVEGFGFQGTLWNGRVSLLNVSGQQLRNTEWDLSLPQLLVGRIGGDFATRWGGGFAEGNGSISLLGTLRLSSTRAGIPAGLLSDTLGAPPLSGTISMDIDELRLSNNWPDVLVASTGINNLASGVIGAGAAGQLGNFRIDFDTAAANEPDQLTGNIEDNGGPLAVTGQILLQKSGEYELRTRIKAREGAPKQLRKNLEFLGPPEDDGTRRFEFAGSI